MTIARAQLVDTTLTRWYHCISRCVRRAFLLGEGEQDRKQWIEQRLQELAEIFAVSVGGFAILDNHLHVLVRLEPGAASAWSDEEVVRRWGRLFPPRDKQRQPLPVSEQWVQDRLQDASWVARTRERLGNLGWFMKCLKEPLSRLCNRQENARGAFFEGRYKSIAILDEEALLSVCAYIDLNPVAAGMAQTPEESVYTSLAQRVAHAAAADRLDDLRTAEAGSVAASARSAALEEELWLCPIENRLSLDSLREGMLEGFPLGSYLLLVDWTARLFREGKAAVSRELAGIFERLGTSAELWQRRMQRLRSGRLWGRFFACRRDRLREGARRLGVRHLANLSACPAP
jgi:hypothetical protein